MCVHCTHNYFYITLLINYLTKFMRYRKNQVYQVVFKNGGGVELYARLKSIYANHSPSEIGCKVEWLWQNKINFDKPFENQKVKISLIQIRK